MTRARLCAVAGLGGVMLGSAARAPAPAPSPPGPDVVGVYVTRPAGPADVATGFAAGRERVVTVAHVLDGRGAVTVRGKDGVVRRARVVRVDRRLDVGVLAVRGLRAAPVRPGDGGAVRLLVRRAGGVKALPARVRRRIVVRLRDAPAGAVYTRPALDLAADVGIGDSGAPVVALDGGVVGAVFARSSARERTAYAVDGAAVADLIAAGSRR